MNDLAWRPLDHVALSLLLRRQPVVSHLGYVRVIGRCGDGGGELISTCDVCRPVSLVMFLVIICDVCRAVSVVMSLVITCNVCRLISVAMSLVIKRDLCRLVSVVMSLVITCDVCRAVSVVVSVLFKIQDYFIISSEK